MFQDLRGATKQRDDMLHEKSALQEDIEDTAGRHRLLQEKEKRMDEHLRKKEREVTHQETVRSYNGLGAA